MNDFQRAGQAGRWEEKEVIDNSEGKLIEQWQSCKCSKCGLYHTTPYLYYFQHYDYCPNCGSRMEAENGENTQSD